MRLGPTQLDWDDRVRRKALECGFLAYGQQQANQRQHAPSLLLLKPGRIIAVWLRTGRRRDDRLPDLSWLPEGIERYVWHPDDWATVQTTLLLPPRDGA